MVIGALSFATKSETVYLNLREQIVNGAIAPGEYLRTKKIADIFGVSETPVREAIFRLEAEGLIEVVPHGGAKVTIPSIEEISEMLEVKLELECIAVRLMMENGNKDGIALLKKCLDEMENLVLTQNVEEYIKLNQKFHSIIYDSAGNSFLVEIIRKIPNVTKRAQAVFRIPNLITRSFEEHTLLYQCIVSKSIQEAQLTIRKHKQQGKDSYINYLKQKI